MAHEIFENDNMMSVRLLPWHGLGIVLDDYPTIQEAQRISGLTWTVRKEPVFFQTPEVGGMSRSRKVPGSFAVVRNDNNYPLGVVGEQYELYQNDQMFEFMDRFTQAANSKIETCGSLRNGRTVWALAQAGTCEYIKNDPVNQYFLFKNGFDGSQNVEICFTDIRVVCNNTLTAALRRARNTFRIRHTSSMHSTIKAVGDIILSQQEHAEAVKGVMQAMSKVALTEDQIRQNITGLVIGFPKELEEGQAPTDEAQEVITAQQVRVIDTIMMLHESGSGSDIKGVRGTAYGALQAVTEYADHFRTIRATSGRSRDEARFESIMMGSASQFKSRAFSLFADMAA